MSEFQRIRGRALDRYRTMNRFLMQLVYTHVYSSALAISFVAKSLITRGVSLFASLALTTVVFSTTLQANPSIEPESISWDSLNSAQQNLLKQLDVEWESLSTKRQQRLDKMSKRYVRMDAEQKQRFLKRMKKWQGMSPEQRERAIKSFRRFRALPPEQRERLKKRYRKFKHLPPDQKDRLKKQWQDGKRFKPSQSTRDQLDSPDLSERDRKERAEQLERRIDALENRRDRLLEDGQRNNR